MHKMTPDVLSKLRRQFKKNKVNGHPNDIDRRVEEVMRAAAAKEGIEFAAPAPAADDALWLTEHAFVTALDTIFGHHKYTTHSHKLYKLLDPFSCGRVWWRQLLNRLVAVGARRTRSRADVWRPLKEGDIKKLDHCKRETIVKLVNVEREDSFCYVAVTKGGRVGVYSGELTLLTSYEVFYHRSGVHRRVKNSWITDVVYLNDVKCLMLSSSDRSLTVYDASTLTHTPVFCITGLPFIPTCLAYAPMSVIGDTSEIAFGNERGDVTRIRFQQPRVSLFYSKSAESINYYFWTELSSPPHTTYCVISTWRKVHSRSVRRIVYTRDGDLLLSCSHDSSVSLRLRQVSGQLDDYVFKMPRGVTCFHVVWSLQVIATGGAGGVRLWAARAPEPYAALTAPSDHSVLDVVIAAALRVVVGYTVGCTILIWDLYEECLLQTIKLKFPFLGVLGKKVEFGTVCIHPGPARKSVDDEDTQSDGDNDPHLDISRRGSSVFQGSTGGLILQPEPTEDWQTRSLEQEPEYVRFNRSEILVTCCDYACVLKLTDQVSGEVLPPPGDTLRARRPSIWELPDDILTISASGATSMPSPRSPRRLEPSSVHYPQDLDSLLADAGLDGILEKDFVLMQGLKQDLNKKLAEMKANMNDMSAAVSVGAPYLALKMYEPVPLEPVNEMTQEYKRVMSLFPGSSVAGTPSGSERSTPKRSARL
ncbi:hypothetical protein ACJJTC_004186 [Scirpophaga incertulas]